MFKTLTCFTLHINLTQPEVCVWTGVACSTTNPSRGESTHTDSTIHGRGASLDSFPSCRRSGAGWHPAQVRGRNMAVGVPAWRYCDSLLRVFRLFRYLLRQLQWVASASTNETSRSPVPSHCVQSAVMINRLSLKTNNPAKAWVTMCLFIGSSQNTRADDSKHCVWSLLTEENSLRAVQKQSIQQILL